MPDITMCDGVGCPMNNICYRYTAIPSSHQSYFMDTPNDGVVCDHFVLDKEALS
jgi:hypothetical protein